MSSEGSGNNKAKNPLTKSNIRWCIRAQWLRRRSEYPRLEGYCSSSAWLRSWSRQGGEFCPRLTVFKSYLWSIRKPESKDTSFTRSQSKCLKTSFCWLIVVKVCMDVGGKSSQMPLPFQFKGGLLAHRVNGTAQQYWPIPRVKCCEAESKAAPPSLWRWTAGSHVAPFGHTSRCSLRRCWSRDPVAEAQPARLFWSHTPSNQNSWGEGWCWHQRMVPRYPQMLLRGNTVMSLGGSFPHCLSTEGVEQLLSMYQQRQKAMSRSWGFPWPPTAETIVPIHYDWWACTAAGSLWARGFVLKAPCTLRSQQSLFPIAKSPRQMRNHRALRQSECGFLPKWVPLKQGEMLIQKCSEQLRRKAPKHGEGLAEHSTTAKEAGGQFQLAFALENFGVITKSSPPFVNISVMPAWVWRKVRLSAYSLTTGHIMCSLRKPGHSSAETSW